MFLYHNVFKCLCCSRRKNDNLWSKGLMVICSRPLVEKLLDSYPGKLVRRIDHRDMTLKCLEIGVLGKNKQTNKHTFETVASNISYTDKNNLFFSHFHIFSHFRWRFLCYWFSALWHLVQAKQSHGAEWVTS